MHGFRYVVTRAHDAMLWLIAVVRIPGRVGVTPIPHWYRNKVMSFWYHTSISVMLVRYRLHTGVSVVLTLDRCHTSVVP